MKEISALNAVDFQKTIASGKVLIDFRAPWCNACKVLDTIIERNSETLPDDLTIAKINIDDNAALAADFDITMIPTLVLYVDGKIIARKSGNFSLPGFLDLLKPVL